MDAAEANQRSDHEMRWILDYPHPKTDTATYLNLQTTYLNNTKACR